MTVFKLNKFGLLEAKDGEEGLAIALREHPDLILLDLMMPKMDGMTMLKKVRADEWGRGVPVIILTNLNATDEHLVEDMITHKPLKYLIKSDWKIHDIVAEVNQALGL